MGVPFRYLLYPNRKQETTLFQWSEAVRWLWNHYLEKNRDLHSGTGELLSYKVMCEDLAALKKRHVWLNDTPDQVLQRTLMQLSTSIAAGFRKKGTGFPAPRSGSDRDTYLISFPDDDSWRLARKNVFVPGMKAGIVFGKDRPFVGTPVRLDITRRENDWFLTVICKK
ncbi:MAG: helix-turn-helix domain-containing protein [Deltaproteobacteria bacterium]|jgi:transposase|nr:helix-turn-helix domain-containing protein [Deltaproteobacteria bacterium]